MPIRIGGHSPVVRPPPDPFKKPTFDMLIPDNLGRPATLADVTVKKGFDGLTPGQATDAVLKHLTTPLAAENKAFVTRQVGDVHKAFTMAVNNAFIAGSPNQKFIQTLISRDIAVVGSMTGSQPSLIRALLPDGKQHYFAKNQAGAFVEVAPPRFVVMEARIRLQPPGVAVSYPEWKCDALSGPTSTITEG
jgi:hypothetical protein